MSSVWCPVVVGRLMSNGRLVVVAVILGTVIFGGGRPAAAHTELESSTPADGEAVAAPVTDITLVFTQGVSTVETGYEVLDPAGQVRTPTANAQPSPATVVLQFDPPLAGGAVGVRWAVAAEDGHIIEGTFSFSVTAPAPTTTVARAPTTTVAATTTTALSAPTTTAPPTTVAATPTSAVVTTTSTTTTTTSSTTPSAPTATTAAPTATTAAPITLDDFLGRTSVRNGDLSWRRLAQVLGVVGSLLGVGWLAFWKLIARRHALGGTGLLPAAGASGVLVVAATVLEAAAHTGAVTGRGLGVITDVGALLDALGASYQTALVLRLLGGGLLGVGAVLAARTTRRAALAVAAAGAAAIVVSFSFDGHTASKGNRLVQTVADLVHVSAAAVWLGGVTALCWLAWRRRRRVTADGSPSIDFLPTLLRFSGVAAWALLAVVLAGGAMTLGIVDGLGDLTATTWGKVLLAKVAVAVLAIAIGAYHRFVLLPGLEADPADAAVRERVTDALAAEAVLLLAVAVLAGILVGSQV